MAFDQQDFPTFALTDASPYNMWLYPYAARNDDLTLQEPVPFEDFEYGSGLNETLLPFPMDIDAFSTLAQQPPPLSDEREVLDEDDHRTFSQFLDTFFIDQQSSPLLDANAPPPFEASPSSSASTLPPPPTALPPVLPCPIEAHNSGNDDQRRSSILQSLDMEKYRIQLHTSSMLTSTQTCEWQPAKNDKKRSAPVSVSTAGDATDLHVTKRSKPAKELLTEEEKRVNHIASEQKRRGTIRSGFKDLASIVPVLKHVNNSKGAVLFRAIEFIRHLEKRNKALRDKAAALESRVRLAKHTTGSLLNKEPTLPSHALSPAAFALEAHKSQQRQLLELQEKLQHHQKRLANRQKRHASTRDEYPHLTYEERLNKTATKQENETSLKTTISAQ